METSTSPGKSNTPRTLDLDSLKLLSGSHAAASKEMCFMEAVAFVAGERWSDHPQCASKVIGAFLRAWNDAMNDEDRQKLKSLIPRLVGTAASDVIELQRSYMALDWYCRVSAPAWLRLAGLIAEAEAIESAVPIVNSTTAVAAQAALNTAKGKAYAARSAAESAARSAAESAARSAAESAARSAAESAARSAAWSAAESAAESAARSAAWSAAESAARSAAWSAARSAAWVAAESAARSAAWSAAESAAWSAARSAAWVAAESAARSAARSAAWVAAESAARSAAWSAAESAAWSAARSAAESAARSAAWSAAESAAWSAAESAARPTVELLQASALELVNRMIACGQEST